MTPDRLDDLATDAVHGRADPADLARLTAWLAADPAHGRTWLAALRRARALHRQLAAAPAAVRRIRAPWPWIAAAAAFVAAGAALALFLPGDPPPSPVAAAVAEDGSVWPPGSLVVLPATAALALRWPDGCRIDLAGATARLQAGEPRLHIDAGRMRAAVEPRSASLAIATPAGTVEVIGTAFTVAVGDAAVDVAVEHGRVRWRSFGRTRILAAGATRAEPRQRLGWRWETNSDRPVLRETLAPGPAMPPPGDQEDSAAVPWLLVERSAGGGTGFTNVGRRVDGLPASMPLRVDAHGARSDLNLIAIEADGDGWLVAHRPLSETGPTWIGMRDPDPEDLRFGHGDGRWDPARVERLVVSLWGDPAAVRLPAATP